MKGTVYGLPFRRETLYVTTLTILPNAGFILDTITVHSYYSETTTVLLDGAGDTRTFRMPPYPVIVRATFKPDDPTGVETPRATSLRAYVRDGVLHVSGLMPGESWHVYNMLGVLVYQGIAVEETAKIPLPACGVYIVADDKAVLKIIH